MKRATAGNDDRADIRRTNSYFKKSQVIKPTEKTQHGEGVFFNAEYDDRNLLKILCWDFF